MSKRDERIERLRKAAVNMGRLNYNDLRGDMVAELDASERDRGMLIESRTMICRLAKNDSKATWDDLFSLLERIDS